VGENSSSVFVNYAMLRGGLYAVLWMMLRVTT